jgi:hypothetical protein
LRLLQFAQEFVFHTLQVHALFLVVGDLFGKLLRVLVDLRASKVSLLLNEVVLLDQAMGALFADLLLAELRLVVVLFSHAIQVVFHHLFLLAHFLDGRQLLVAEAPIAVHDLLLLLLATLACILTIIFLLL